MQSPYQEYNKNLTVEDYIYFHNYLVKLIDFHKSNFKKLSVSQVAKIAKEIYTLQNLLNVNYF